MLSENWQFYGTKNYLHTILSWTSLPWCHSRLLPRVQIPHCYKPMVKTGTRNSIPVKLSNTNWGIDAIWRRTIRRTAYLCGIAPTHIISSQLENTQTRKRHSTSSLYYEQDPARKRLKSRHSFLHSVEPLGGNARTQRLTLWSSYFQTTPHTLSFSLKESLPPGSSEAWPTWSSLNRLRTGTGWCKTLIQKLVYNENGQTACECGDELTMKHLLVCPILLQPCSHEYLEESNTELIWFHQSMNLSPKRQFC